jgi:hypothetical protein
MSGVGLPARDRRWKLLGEGSMLGLEGDTMVDVSVGVELGRKKGGYERGFDLVWTT